MKKIILKSISALALAATTGCVALVFVGCSSTKVQVDKDGGWSVTVDTDWTKREIQSFHAKKDGTGVVEVDFNGYKHDTSEQLAKNAAEFWYGVSVLGRLAGATFNPAVASVPLDREAASAVDTAALVKAQADAKAALVKARAEEKAVSAPATPATAGAQADCADGSSTAK